MTGQQGAIGDYQFVARIDEGGMGAVFRAVHRTLGNEVAIKVLPPTLASDPTARQYFERGAASAAALQHPNVLPVYYYGEHEGAPYLVMPYLTGGTLKDRLARGPLGFGEIIRTLEQLAAALDYAHGRGVVHRDVKPANLLLDERGQLYLADFGIAKALESATRFTRTGTTVGTPEYMAPEQARDQADHRSDLYAMGIILYQLLAGRVPFTGASAVGILMQHINDPLPLIPLRQVNPALPPAIVPVVERALAKDPDARYQCGADLVAALSAALAGAPERPAAGLPDTLPVALAPRTPTPTAEGGTPSVTPWPTVRITPTPVPGPPARRNRLVIGLSVALAAALLFCSVAGTAAAVRLRPTPMPAPGPLATAVPTMTAVPTTVPSPSPTVGPTATATVVPSPSPTATATATRQPTATPTFTPSPTPVTGQPNQPIPAGWLIYPGTPQIPFALAYPRDWRVDTSSAADGLIYFRAPNRDDVWVSIYTSGRADPSANVDGLRNDYYRWIASVCTKYGVEATNDNVYSGVTFARLGATCDTSNGLYYYNAGLGLRNQVTWRYRFSARYGEYNDLLNAYFGPMVHTLNIYADPRP